jgi:pimeloyl-ACP methyl ester carboxylesterase
MGEIYYQGRGKGFPLVLIHGFCETNEIWDSFAEKLSSDFRVITPDLPGFGRSPLLDKRISITGVAAALNTWLHQIDIGQCVVIGHSLGGYVTLSMIAQEPNLITGFGLFHSTAFPDSEEKRQNRNKVFEFVNKNGVLPFVETFVPGLFHQKDNPSIEKVYSIASKTPKETLMAYTLAMRDRPVSTSLLTTYKGECLFIGGKYDSLIPQSVMEEQSRLNAKSELRILENSGHMGMFEDAETAFKAVQSFGVKVRDRPPKR